MEVWPESCPSIHAHTATCTSHKFQSTPLRCTRRGVRPIGRWLARPSSITCDVLHPPSLLSRRLWPLGAPVHRADQTPLGEQPHVRPSAAVPLSLSIQIRGRARILRTTARARQGPCSCRLVSSSRVVSCAGAIPVSFRSHSHLRGAWTRRACVCGVEQNACVLGDSVTRHTLGWRPRCTSPIRRPRIRWCSPGMRRFGYVPIFFPCLW